MFLNARNFLPLCVRTLHNKKDRGEGATVSRRRSLRQKRT